MYPERHVYIVEDDPDIAAVARHVCARAGVSAACFAAVSDFLETPNLSDDSVVLLDLWLADGNGVDILRALAARRCGAVIYLMSGQDDRLLHTVQKLGQSYGLDVRGVLRKPFPVRDLEDAIRTLPAAPEAIEPKGTFAEQMHRAIIGGELRLYYQPKVDVTTRSLAGCEALIRWQRPGRGLVGPGDFLPAAEEAGLMGAMTRWVLEEATRQVAEWRRLGLVTSVSVNMPADMLNEMHLPQLIEDLLNRHGLPGSALILEVTEAAAMKNLLTALDVLARLRLMGVSLSIDDFGTGHASIVKLRQLPFNEMKIDRSFIADMEGDRDARVLVGAMIDMAHSFGMTTVGEGVETPADLAHLKSLGCAMAQGFYFSRPLPPAELAAWIVENDATAKQAKADCLAL